MNYYEHWLGDYRKKTGRLRPLEHGVYRLLLDEYYALEEPLPPGWDDLYHICRAVSPSEKDAVRKIADIYFPIDPADGLRHNERADEEIEKAQRRISTSRSNGKGGGRPRKAEPDNPPPNNPTGYEKKPVGFAERNPTGTPTAPPSETRPGVPHTPYPMQRAEAVAIVGVFSDVWPKNLNAATWVEWKAHLTNKGKGITPQQERLQLVRLCGHEDAEGAVLNAIEKGHATLPPPGGWPSDQRAKFGNLAKDGRQTAVNLTEWQPPAPKENAA